ncbi:GNAT family N-acetyltransferase [Salinimicrobium sp. TH3]|uniref:GNAT family N-acetyltransferase n=1 Tax=Salinimicrobium sp. TH3 TaxID=2997342 RepID=UPI002274DD51|nr:GNAT family N-acetyltransferase [Salinimicrobium sp. TH3]MCY2686971.1 GNAT family N-acetyltransferase [Salinimicrobium sp. TH3]
MIIREAVAADVPEIVQVLKASLGETELPLSEEIWNYKHRNNPFGQSIVLIAIEDKNIVGVRALMRWKWHRNGKEYFCLRAVDTATHPKHQGKGIFKKLTLKAVDVAQTEGADFIFNTPNEKSRPGYLKMGWEISGKLKVGLSPAILSFWKFRNSIPEYEIIYQTSFKRLEDLCTGWNLGLEKEKLHTKKSAKYLKWRYEENPLQAYEVLVTSNFYLAGYIKKRKKIKELRIVECIFQNKSGEKEADKIIRKWSMKFGAQVISFSPLLKKELIPSIKGKFGPLATVRNLNLTEIEREACFTTENWTYSLGDLELF